MALHTMLTDLGATVVAPIYLLGRHTLVP